MTWKQVGDFCIGAVRDPVTKDLSSSRIAGLLCVLGGIVYAFIMGPILNRADAATVAALVGGGAVPFLTRVKSGEG